MPSNRNITRNECKIWDMVSSFMNATLALQKIWRFQEVIMLKLILDHSIRFLSTLNIILVAVDRYLSIKEPYTYRQSVYVIKRRIRKA